jgi:dCMP deaminase
LPRITDTAIPEFSGKTEEDRYYLSLALKERTKSDDPRAHLTKQSGVGAVIVGKSGIIEQSANILPSALRSYHDNTNNIISEQERYHFIEHAERAAIFSALLNKHDLKNSTIYCTRFPCSDCARAIVWVGIKRAVFATGYTGESRWIESQRAAVSILRNANLTVRVLNIDKQQPLID